MKKFKVLAATVLCFCLLFGCVAPQASTPSLPKQDPAPPVPELPETTDPPKTTEPPVTTEPPEQEHSALYIPGIGVEEVLSCFNEVCLDAEYIHNGDASLVQKWEYPIRYTVHGSPTEEDLAVLQGFADWLNTLEGFPGIYEDPEGDCPNLQIHFCSQEELLMIMGSNFTGQDGAVTFWYLDNEIYDAIICIRTDLDQVTRNSVILEELYNGLGPMQDTQLREDSIIYAGFSQPQALTEMDELILLLLYHPEILRGMNATECEAVIRRLYY